MAFARFRPVFCASLLAVGCFRALPHKASAEEKLDATQLIALAKAASPQLRDAITASFAAKELQEGTSWAGRGPDFFFALEAEAKPELIIVPRRAPRKFGTQPKFAAAGFATDDPVRDCVPRVLRFPGCRRGW